MATPKKMTKFKSKKGVAPVAKPKGSLGGGARSIKKSSGTGSTAHALPSQAQVVEAQQIAQPPPAIPKASPPSRQVTPQPRQPVSQSQTMVTPPLPVDSKKTGAQSIHPPPAPGILKGSTIQGTVPGGMKSKEPDSSDKQLEAKVEELSDQVCTVLEIADSLLDSEWTPEKIIDIIHVMVRSVNLDVVTMLIPSMNYPEQLDIVHSRGYDISPRKAVIDLWLKTFDEKIGVDWKKLMKLAEDNKSDLAYWIVHEGLDSIGYVPIRDGRMIYGFLFVASSGKKEQSILTAPLLDLCGTQLGMAYALKFMKGS